MLHVSHSVSVGEKIEKLDRQYLLTFSFKGEIFRQMSTFMIPTQKKKSRREVNL